MKKRDNPLSASFTGFKAFKVKESLNPYEGQATPEDTFDLEKNRISKFAFATRGGFQPQNPRKVNQDAFILAPHILHSQSMHLFAVGDGHG